MAVVYSVDLTAQATQVFATAGAITIDGLTWYAKGSLSSGALERGLLNGSGLYIGTVSGFAQPVIGTSATLTFPCFFLPFSNVPGFDPSKAYLVRGRFSCTVPGNVAPLVGVVDTTSDDVNVQSTHRARDRLCGPIASAGSSLQMNHKLGVTGITTANSLSSGTQDQRVAGIYHLTSRFAAVGGEILASGMPAALDTWLPLETAPIKDYATVANPGAFFFANFLISAAGGGATRAFMTHLQLEQIGDVDLIQQRVYDSTAGWCYYVKTFSDPSPASSETQPNHTNNLVGGSHQLLGIRVDA